MKQKVLVTGGSGFIGRQVVDELIIKGYEVHSIYCSHLLPKKESLIQHKLNLLDLNSVNKFFEDNSFEYLLHLAWYVGAKCHISNLNIDWTIASLNLFKSFIENNGKKILCAGSISEYDYSYGYFVESKTPTNSGTLYGEAKSSLYKLTKTLCKQNNVLFQWPRVFNLYGPWEKKQRLMPYVINSCLNNEDINVSDCLKFQDYLHVNDMAKGIITLFESNYNDAVNICSGNPIRLRNIVEYICNYTNFEGKVNWGAIPSAFGNEIVVGNNDLLKSLGWKQEIFLEDGLQQTISWWKRFNNGELYV